MGGNNENTRTAAPKRTVAKVPKGRKYNNDAVKCSVDIGAKARHRSEENVASRAVGPARGVKFEKGGGGGEKTVKSCTSDTPRDARARACSAWMDSVIEMGVKGIRLEWVKEVKHYKPDSSKFTKNVCGEYPHCNRYENVLCLDQSRVVLKLNPDNDGDFIHANYVRIHPDLIYICAQGPLAATVHHFWYMIIQEKVKVVLQLCQFMEAFREGEEKEEKCAEYFPHTLNESKTYGLVEVRVTEVNRSVAGMRKVTKSKIQVKLDKQTHEITHILYAGWPDHDVAESVGTCREVRNLIHRIYEKKPIIAHCSAGVGRTGSFVMIELLAHRLLHKHDADFRMVDLVKQLREQRLNAIQTDQQYLFIYRAVVEVLLAEGALAKSPEVTKFIEDYDALIQRKKKERAKAAKTC